MNAAELTTLVARQEEQIGGLRRDLDALAGRVSQIEAATSDLGKELAVMRQAIDDVRKAVDNWSGRWWTIVTLIIGSLLACVSSLLVALLRK